MAAVAASLDSFVTDSFAEQVKSGFLLTLVTPSSKNHADFSPTNAGRNSGSRRGAEFTWPRTCISSVERVSVTTLSKGRMTSTA